MVRIRKNLKVSPLQFFPNVAPEDLQTHICKLNQSPWDSSSCPLDLDSSSSPLQFEAGEGFIRNGSLGDSIAAVESVASPMDIDKPEMAPGDDKVIVRCQKNDGRSWQCKKEAKEGFLFCDHHIRRSSYNNNVSSNGNILPSNFVSSKKDSAAPAKTLDGTRRTRPKAAKKGPNPANPYEFYYYSGFGPKWGRKRGKKGKAEEEDDENYEEGTNNIAEAAAENVAASASSSSGNTDPQPSSPHNVGNGDQLDYMEDDFDDEDGSDEEGGPRRMRRPVKARSLMSIINVKAQE
ncbi:uncharacterized protein LOC126803968 [Argentina anserina]|uniref:uncharacterized protein LOC126803968 n=1 Tax=Argentina anserina TaxID=57926 RepID=UPI00217685BA|nr:uncharacterized protein LOC126803968 [Potentilla anserina]